MTDLQKAIIADSLLMSSLFGESGLAALKATVQEAVIAGRLLLSSSEAARLLGVSDRTVARLKADGDLPFVTVGESIIRYDVLDLLDYITRRKNKEPASV